MKNRRKTNRLGTMKAIWTILGLVAFMGLSTPQSANAAMGADGVIINVANVQYFDASGLQEFNANASASVTITLVPSALNVAETADPSPVPSGTTATYAYTLTASANGDDQYDLIITKGVTADVANDTLSWKLVNPDLSDKITGSPNQLSLGASAVSDTTGATTLEFPGGTLDEFAAGDVVVINGTEYLVNGVTIGNAGAHENDGGPHSDVGAFSTAEVKGQLDLRNMDGSAPDFTVTVINDGTPVFERAYLEVDVYAETTTAGVDGTVPFTIDTDTNVDGAADATNNSTQVSKICTFESSSVTITKTVDSATGVSGDTLEYTITVTASGAQATKVVITDAVPAYTTLDSDGYGAGIFAQANLNASGAIDITAVNSDTEDATVASGDAPLSAAGSPITFYVGNGNNGDVGGGTETGGTLDDTDSIVITYKVTIQ